MKKTQDGKKANIPELTVDPSLDKYKHMNLFPEKLAQANKMLKTAKLPHKKQGA